MTLEVRAVSKSEDGDAQCPQLALWDTLSMPAAASSMSLGPVLLAEGCAASNALYHLVITVAGVPEPLTVPFTFTDASGWTQEKSAAKQRTNQAQQQVNELTAAVGKNRGDVHDAAAQVDRVLEAAQGALGHAINLDNWTHVRNQCQAEWNRLHQLPPPRPAQIARPKLSERQRAELDRVPGVIGFVHELLYVADDDEARLLSWFAGSKLEDLFVANAETKNAVRGLWERWGLMGRQSVNIVYLSTSSQPGPLPHSGDPLLCHSCLATCLMVTTSYLRGNLPSPTSCALDVCLLPTCCLFVTG